MRFVFLLVLIITISCSNPIDRKKEGLVGNENKIDLFKNESFKSKIISFIKSNPKEQPNIETYYISFCVKDNDTIVTFKKGLYSDTFAFIDKKIEFKGWFKYNGNYINIIDRKQNPIGQALFDYNFLSKKKINSKKMVEYHGQRKLHRLIVNKQFLLKNDTLKIIKSEKRVCVFH